MNRLLLSLIFLVACSGDDSSTSTDAATNPAVDASGAQQTVVPVTETELFAYLQAGTYMEFESESSVHVSDGPHGAVGVRSFINDTLMASLAAGNTAHPVGSSAVKELHGASGVSGWAVEVKTQSDSASGDGWYWYEVFSTTDSSNPISGNGNSICTGCHSKGSDYVRLSFPLL